MFRCNVFSGANHNSLINPRIELAHFASLVRIAAHYGHPKAAADLAFMYQHGFKGAPQDRTKAAQWASVAVEQDLAAGTTHSLALGVDKLRFFSPEDDENAFITDEGEESETIPEGGSYVTITPMRPAEHYLGRPRPRASPGSFDGDDGIKRVLIGAIIIGVIGVVALLLVV